MNRPGSSSSVDDGQDGVRLWDGVTKAAEAEVREEHDDVILAQDANPDDDADAEPL